MKLLCISDGEGCNLVFVYIVTPLLKDTPLEKTQILAIKYCDYNVMLPLTKAHLSNKDELFGRSDLPITGGPL